MSRECPGPNAKESSACRSCVWSLGIPWALAHWALVIRKDSLARHFADNFVDRAIDSLVRGQPWAPAKLLQLLDRVFEPGHVADPAFVAGAVLNLCIRRLAIHHGFRQVAHTGDR